MLPKLRPTGTCFDDALDFVSTMINGSHESAKEAWSKVLTIVHGICTAPLDEPYAHAWVEIYDTVWQGGIVVANGQRVFYPTLRTEFYAERRVTQTTRYTVQEADRLNELHDNFGPWEERYRALCRPRV